jgi:hypothetical protein
MDSGEICDRCGLACSEHEPTDAAFEAILSGRPSIHCPGYPADLWFRSDRANAAASTVVLHCDCPEGPTLRWDSNFCSICGHDHDQFRIKSGDANREKLEEALSELEPDAIASLLYLAERLLVGQRAYGKIDLRTDPRDWKKEILAEVGDLLVYFAFEELKRQLSPAGSAEARELEPRRFSQRQCHLVRGTQGRCLLKLGHSEDHHYPFPEAEARAVCAACGRVRYEHFTNARGTWCGPGCDNGGLFVHASP